MPNEFSGPGVHVDELPRGPRPIESPVTDRVAFIGYTERALDPRGPSLHLTPVRLGSFSEFEQYFGAPFIGASKTPAYLLGWAVRLFFANGGRRCVVVSVGTHGETRNATALLGGLERLDGEDDVPLLAVPDAATLPRFDDYRSVVNAMLAQCGARRDRFAIVDVWNGQLPPEALVDAGPPDGPPEWRTVIEASRSALTADLAWGAAYYPFLELRADSGVLELPPSGVVAGAYGYGDLNRGVWKAPTGMALAGVVRPVVALSDAQQDPLNVDLPSGKSINVIRAFTGRGTMIWGARTLLGNDPEWKYVSVRRLVMMIETAVQTGTAWAAFEPNAAPLWTMLREAVEAYLTPLWREGALHGARPQEAFAVRCGPGQTMTAQDVQEGRVILMMQLAVSRPAEFISIRVIHRTAES